MLNASFAKFITSATNLSQMPLLDAPQIVFLGRSNVGKSSFINALTNAKSLAKSSSTPGKTRLINFFEVHFKNDESGEIFKMIFVDLPGFGYAKVSKKERILWGQNLDNYIKKAQNIKLFIHLIDSRHFDLQNDANLRAYVTEILRFNQRFITFYTKCDKLNQAQISALRRFDESANLVSVYKNINKARELIVKNVFESVDL